MQIESIRHKALRRFAETGSSKRPAERLGGSAAEHTRLPRRHGCRGRITSSANFGGHKLTGDRAGTWAQTVTRNWRLTFRINESGATEDVDLEDYH